MPENLETENGKSSYVWVKASNEHAGSQLERLRSQCGSPRDVEARGLAYFDGQGSPVGFVGAIQDLGGRTAELERSNQALRRQKISPEDNLPRWLGPWTCSRKSVTRTSFRSTS